MRTVFMIINVHYIAVNNSVAPPPRSLHPHKGPVPMGVSLLSKYHREKIGATKQAPYLHFSTPQECYQFQDL